MLLDAPFLLTDIAAAADDIFKFKLISYHFNRPDTKNPQKVSPAPVVSIVFTL